MKPFLTMCRYDTCQQVTTSLMYSATTGDVTALRRLHGGGCDMEARYIKYSFDKFCWLFLSSPSPKPQPKSNKVPKRRKEKGIWTQGWHYNHMGHPPHPTPPTDNFYPWRSALGKKCWKKKSQINENHMDEMEPDHTSAALMILVSVKIPFSFLLLGTLLDLGWGFGLGLDNSQFVYVW